MAPTGWREVGGLHTEGKKSRIRGVGDVAPYGFSYIFKQTTAILLCVILSEATKARFSSQTRYRRSRFAVNGESKDLDRGKKPRARCEHAKLFRTKMLLCVHWSATLLLRSHKVFHALRFARLPPRLTKLRCPRFWRARRHTALRWSRLRSAQDGAEGKRSRITGRRMSSATPSTPICRFTAIAGAVPYNEVKRATTLKAKFLCFEKSLCEQRDYVL